MNYANGMHSFIARGAEIIAECEIEESARDRYYWQNAEDYYWSKIIVELPEEPDRFTYGDDLYTFA